MIQTDAYTKTDKCHNKHPSYIINKSSIITFYSQSSCHCTISCIKNWIKNTQKAPNTNWPYAKEKQPKIPTKNEKYVIAIGKIPIFKNTKAKYLPKYLEIFLNKKLSILSLLALFTKSNVMNLLFFVVSINFPLKS